MSKKNKKVIPALDQSDVQQNAEIIEAETEEKAVETSEVEVSEKKKNVKDTQVVDKKSKKAKKEKKPSKLGRKLKETGAELKKVTWPTFPKVLKQTGVVLGVVVFFGLVLFAFDYCLNTAFKALNSQTLTASEIWGTVGIVSALVIATVVGLTIWLVKRRKGNK